MLPNLVIIKILNHYLDKNRYLKSTPNYWLQSSTTNTTITTITIDDLLIILKPIEFISKRWYYEIIPKLNYKSFYYKNNNPSHQFHKTRFKKRGYNIYFYSKDNVNDNQILNQVFKKGSICLSKDITFDSIENLFCNDIKCLLKIIKLSSYFEINSLDYFQQLNRFLNLYNYRSIDLLDFTPCLGSDLTTLSYTLDNQFAYDKILENCINLLYLKVNQSYLNVFSENLVNHKSIIKLKLFKTKYDNTSLSSYLDRNSTLLYLKVTFLQESEYQEYDEWFNFEPVQVNTLNTTLKKLKLKPHKDFSDRQTMFICFDSFLSLFSNPCLESLNIEGYLHDTVLVNQINLKKLKIQTINVNYDVDRLNNLFSNLKEITSISTMRIFVDKQYYDKPWISFINQKETTLLDKLEYLHLDIEEKLNDGQYFFFPQNIKQLVGLSLNIGEEIQDCEQYIIGILQQFKNLKEFVLHYPFKLKNQKLLDTFAIDNNFHIFKILN
ncbi:hypothetical protein CYY_008996 [Polysphondylium violaceum]|uniref:Uncharacterized protein n=1 Tax=Polysphondylium violaceum TaxID=133409 RepID=A0A8J4UWL1_9MYCE|nr:hypothetical protein CYY_008996 [Polysphondylium violaceum]